MAENLPSGRSAESDNDGAVDDVPPASEVYEADTESLVLVSREKVTYHQGPLPDPDTLARMGEIYAAAPEIVFKSFSAQNAHRIKIETAVVNNDIKLSERGQYMGFALGVLAITLGFAAIVTGHDWAGVAVSTTGVTGLVGTFVYGRKSDRAERLEKKIVQEQVRRGDPVEKLVPPKDDSSDA